MNILGISAFYHDSAVCLVQDGRIAYAAGEERFSRIKHDYSFPHRALADCLDQNRLSVHDIDYVVFYEKPFIKFERILETYLSYAPVGISSFMKAMPLWVKRKLWMRDLIRKEFDYTGKIIFPEHHETHAAAAFFPSPFQEAAFLTIDAVGEWTTTSFGVGKDNKISIMGDMRFPHSVGLLYSAFTYYTGFKVNSGEYKLMGLAPYGQPRYKDIILRELIDLKEDGSFRLNMKYFNYCVGLTMTNSRFHKLFGGPPRNPDDEITGRHMDLARSVQAVTEEIVLRMARHVREKTNQRYLCLAGGVALNCVANGRLLREGIFEDIWIQPAAGDAGDALGSALLVWYQYLENGRTANRSRDAMQGALLGPQFSDDQIEAFLTQQGIVAEKIVQEQLPARVAALIAKGNVIGWFQGRMEFGPRALGNRSILGDARSPDMQRIINLKVKFRESFRPFAPSVLQEKVSEYFDFTGASPYMLLVAPVKAQRLSQLSEEEQSLSGLDKLKVVRSSIPAVTHVDNSARIQTVDQHTNPLYYQLLRHLDQDHGCPVIINTSFNVRGEPIVCTPEEAYQCFITTGMDYLVMGNYLLAK